MKAIWIFGAASIFILGPVPADDEGLIRRWTFDSPGNLEGWGQASGIGDLRVAGGKLLGRLTDADAYIFSPPASAPMDGLVVRVRWSSPGGGTCQCFFTTNESPGFGEDKVVTKEVEGGRVETEFDLDPGSPRPPTLVRFRLDPFNGNRGAAFEIDEVALVRLPPKLEIEFAPEKAAVKLLEKVGVRLRLKHLGGRRLQGAGEAEIEGAGGRGGRKALEPAADGFGASWEISFEKAGVHTLAAKVYREGLLTHDLEASIAVGLPEKPGGERLEGPAVSIELIPSAKVGGSFSGARLRARKDGSWLDAGLLLPLAEIVMEEKGTVRRIHPPLEILDRSAGRLLLGLRESLGPSALKPSLELKAEGGAGAPSPQGAVIAVRARLEGAPGTRLLKLAGPSVKVLAGGGDPLDRHGIFGGIEFLEPGWRSSSDRAVGPKFADRWTPHPFKISLPVMAMEAGGVTTAVLWDPLQSWAPGKTMPAATFASPNFLECQEGNHRMQLSAPSVGEFVKENGSLAEKPYVLAGDPVEVSLAIHAACDEPVLRTARLWYELYGIPDPPPAPHGDGALYDILARCYGETTYWPKEKGWRHHWFLDRSSSYQPEVAAEVILHAKVTGEKRWVQATGLDPGKSLIETAGPLWGRALGSSGPARAAVRAMGEDGTYPYREPASVKEAAKRHSGGRFDSLGPEGSTTLGTCVQGSLPLLQGLLLTGDPNLLGPAEKALKAMRRFRAPRGAQVWEVPLEVPDIRAAALAVEAFRIGYLVTGDESYLDDARRWADAGLPFLFTWRVPIDLKPAFVRTSRDRDDPSKTRSHPAIDLFQNPRRQVTPYGTIPVLGTTFYAMSWFGVLVQWCGLEWAWKVLELCELRDDKILRAAAEGVVRSGLQQMFDREPWTGLYPDVWDLQGNWAGGALISPRLFVQALRAGGHIPRALDVWTRRAGEGPEALLIHGWGEAVACEGGREGFRVTVRFLENEPGEILVARSPRPLSVTAGGKEIPEGENGWRHDAGRQLLGIRYASPSKEARIEVRYR